MSKSELKRLCTQNPLDAAERIAELEQRVKVLTDGINNALYALSEEHGDDHFESECPICNAYKQLDGLLNHTAQQTSEQI